MQNLLQPNGSSHVCFFIPFYVWKCSLLRLHFKTIFSLTSDLLRGTLALVVQDRNIICHSLCRASDSKPMEVHQKGCAHAVWIISILLRAVLVTLR